MTIETLVARYGFVAIFLGAGLEGETAVVTGGLLAHAGLVSLPSAMVAASVGSCVADQLFFVIGRYFRDRAFVRRLTRRAAFARALGWMERYPVGFIFAFRFIYGLRTISPFAIGTTQVPGRVFLPVNIVAAIVWGCAFTAIGYLFGREFHALLGRYEPSRHTVLIAGAAAVGIVGAVLVARRLTRR